MKMLSKLLIFVLLILPNIGIGQTHSEGFFSIGWSEKGDVFAYGFYVHNANPEFSSSEIVIRIQNMINDSVLYAYSKTWEETFRGDEYDVYPPASAEKALQEISVELNKALNTYKIKRGEYPLRKFPPLQDSDFMAEVRAFDMEPGYGLYIKYYNGTEKMISHFSVELSEYDSKNMILGYVLNHANDRIAVILSFVTGYQDIITVGCYLKSGFSKKGK